MSFLKFENIYYKDGQSTILKDISLTIEERDFISVVGPSGSGKSTFLKLCSNLISPSHGNIYYSNKNLFEYSPIELRKEIAYCFQTPYLFGDSVLDNLSFPYGIRNKKIDLERINELLSLFNLDKEIINKDVRNLSGGEKQRISLIRTLLFKPKILLLDEVTSALDVDNTLIVEEVLKKLNEDGITILWITHNPTQWKKYSNKVLTIENGEIRSLEVVR